MQHLHHDMVCLDRYRTSLRHNLTASEQYWCKVIFTAGREVALELELHCSAPAQTSAIQRWWSAPPKTCRSCRSSSRSKALETMLVGTLMLLHTNLSFNLCTACTLPVQKICEVEVLGHRSGVHGRICLASAAASLQVQPVWTD